MDFYQRAAGRPKHLGILPGTFNPLTIAHMALARAGLDLVDEVVFVLPQVFPHKHYWGASFEQRLDMLRCALGNEPGISIASTTRGLFREIAEECRTDYGHGTRISFLCGRDAAERIVNWDYGAGITLADMPGFDLLVAARGGEFDPPAELKLRINPLPLGGDFETISATEVRERIERGMPWEHLVPPAVSALAREIYSSVTDRAPDSQPGS